jgi:hypothetical protein
MTQPKKPASSARPTTTRAGSQRATPRATSAARKPATASTARKPATGARKPATASTARKPAGASAARKPASASTAAKAPAGTTAAGTAARSQARPRSAAAVGQDVEQRLQELNQRIIAAGRKVGVVSLDLYEATLKNIADALERGPGTSDVEWVAKVATSQADFLREATKTWTSAARGALK